MGLSVVLTWLYIRTRGNILIPIVFHAGQNLFVFLNEGITLTQQLWLLTVVTLVFSLVIIYFFGTNMRRGRVEKPVMVSPEPAEMK
jgi:preprotein translocase subunit SecF